MSLPIAHEQPDWLLALQETGAEAFEKSGLPTPANEDWKYTSLRPYERENFTTDFAPVTITVADLPEKLCAHRLVFINGRFHADLSDAVKGLRYQHLQSGLDAQDEIIQEQLVDIGQLADMPLKAENTAHIADGAAFILNAGQSIEEPVEILYFSTAKDMSVKPKYYSRNVFSLGAGASCTVVEHFAGEGTYAANHVTDISLKDEASFKHYRLQKDAKTAYHFAHTRLMQHDKSSYETMTLTAGARLSRCDIQSFLIGAEVSCNINGLYMLVGDQHYDAKVLVDHMEPEGTSKQLFKGILDDKTRAVFQGKVHVRRAAQGTDGRQLSHALLLSADAEVDSKPELEIYADDVQCAHGATSGALDEEPLFYMQSRGIPLDQARNLLIASFLSDVIKDIADVDIQAIFQSEIDVWLNSQGKVA